jgi:hypothetical protein
MREIGTGRSVLVAVVIDTLLHFSNIVKPIIGSVA